jgi:hypothetical protein
MAKKTKGKLSSPEVAPGEFKPCLYLDMQGQDVAQLKELNIGDKVEIMVRGTVKGLSQRQRTDYDDSSKTIKTGTIDLENYDVEVLGDEENEFEKMAGEDA